jgi:hypothetical protein
MPLRLQQVDPSAFIEPASRILQESWQPPCIYYSDDYLRWQFRFPGALPASGTAAFDGDEPVGFTAVIPRWLRLGGVRLPVLLSSFHAVRPAWRGPAGVGVLRAGIRSLRDMDMPVVVFTVPGSEAERMVRAAYAAFGFQCRPLGHYPTYAALARPGQPGGPVTAVEAQDVEDFAAALRACDVPRRLWNAPDRDQLEHYRKDPRERVLVRLEDPTGRPLGAAMLMRADVLTAAGRERVATIDSVSLPEPSADALRALARFAADRWADRVTSPVVMAPNLLGIDPGLLRLAGFRVTPSAFNGYLFFRDRDHAFRDAEATNLEIV